MEFNFKEWNTTEEIDLEIAELMYEMEWPDAEIEAQQNTRS